MSDSPIQSSFPILDAIGAGMVVLDRDRRIIRWNAWMAGASGKTTESVHGRTLAEVFPLADFRRLDAAISSAIDSRWSSLLTHALHSHVFPLKTRAGREMLHDVTVSSIDGSVDAQCLIQVTDVTMAVRRERYLRDRQKARYDSVAENAPDGILTLDGASIIQLANQAAVTQFGYPVQELVGQNAEILFESSSAWLETWHKVLQDESLSHPIELVARRKDGSATYLEVSASRWQDGSHLMVTAILRDISERRAAQEGLRASEEQARAAAAALAELNITLEQRVEDRTKQLLEVEEALRQSHKMEAIGQLTGGIAHDFNNLLQGIVGALNMVQRRVVEGRMSDVERFVKGALGSAERASALTHRLLAFSRRQPIDPRPIDVNQLIRTTEELLRRTIGEKTKMSLECADGLWLVRCDGNQLENALLNLAINARDAMPDGGTLTISTRNVSFDSSQALIRDIKPGAYVCITIKDTGAGMPPDVQARAFDPFFTTKPIGKGTGLGLSMIYGFVRQSEGSVRIQSEVGQGTAIEVSMPRFDGSLDDVGVVAADADASAIGNNEVVLVVEDEDMVRLLVVEVLNDLGYRVLEATDGPSALRILQSPQRVDLLVTDIGLPDINGRQVADAARIKRPKLRVLFMTGYAESAMSGELLDDGMQLIAKPFTMDKLSAKIRQIFDA